MICYPDKGAVSKYSEIYAFGLGTPIYGEKVRDQSTGNITSYQLIGNLKGRTNVLIVDDICDGGATFKLLAKDLLAAGATEVNLFVSHGIFSRGLRTLQESGIKRIFTKDGEASTHQNQITYRRL
jgi:ribose-phosphate pyrophosphokinase